MTIILLGYGANQKGYRLYDINRMKVIHSRDVTSVPGLPTEKESGSSYVELEVEEEPSGIKDISRDGRTGGSDS